MRRASGFQAPVKQRSNEGANPKAGLLVPGQRDAAADVRLSLRYLIFPQPPVLTQAAYEALFPFQGHYAVLDNGARVHYVDEGEGRTLLLLH